ncbi:MAG: hypothetical protein MUC85_03215 [Anaerolineales bacterium]|jgi:hypothetical protein|nr:hypothetical protein [Anaerolineales bacterium]
MSQNNSGPLRPYNPGVFGGISNRVKLILRLMVDGRVNPLLKLIPFASGVYLLFPDLMPGPVDDALLIWLSTYLFVELCPPDVVAELEGQISPGSAVSSQPADMPFKEEDIIEAEIVQEDPEQK